MLKAIPELLARFTIGWVFLFAGLGKFQNMERTVGFFEAIKIPAPSIQAPFVATVEVVGGLFILLGLFTRIASLPLIIVMIVALLTAHASDIGGLSDLVGMSQFCYIVILVFLAVYGGEYLALDKVLCRFFPKWKCCPTKAE